MNNYFVDYLENFHDTEDTERNITDYYLLNNYILTNYYYNNFYQDHLYHMKTVMNHTVSSPSNLYYDCYSQSAWNPVVFPPNNVSNYDTWKANSEFKFDLSNNNLHIGIPPPGLNPIIKKKLLLIQILIQLQIYWQLLKKIRLIRNVNTILIWNHCTIFNLN